MAGELKDAMNKAADAVAGTMGKMGAAMTTSHDGLVEQAVVGDANEIEAGRLALRRPRNDAIRAVAKKMVDDHTPATQRLTAALEMNETVGSLHPLKGSIPVARRC